MVWIAQEKKILELSRPRVQFDAKQKSELQNFVLEGHPVGLGLDGIRGRPLMIWGGGGGNREKDLGGPSPGKNKS